MVSAGVRPFLDAGILALGAEQLELVDVVVALALGREEAAAP